MTLVMVNLFANPCLDHIHAAISINICQIIFVFNFLKIGTQDNAYTDSYFLFAIFVRYLLNFSFDPLSRYGH